ncbi:MAG: hypothetical protein ABIQ27_05905 [Flavobacterium sp.]|uniref:hypothetical protein n=1 Tax=Flavobacterium sp. TaxID=239 RepID=UPI003265C2CD
MKKLIFIVFITFSNLIFSQVSEKILNDNFLNLLESDQACYLINFEDLNTNEIKEICILDNAFISAFEIENNIIHDETKCCDYLERYFYATNLIKKNGSRNFKFKNPKSLEILNENYISYDELNEFNKRLTINLIIQNFKKGENLSINIADDDYKYINYYGYLLSKEGFQINYFLFNCFGPNNLFCSNCQKK